MKSIQFIIALNIILFLPPLRAEETLLGGATKAILGAEYDAFATSSTTEEGKKASCVSSVIYGLRASGHKCEYRDFKAYQRALRGQAKTLIFGKTPSSKEGLVIFNGTHFTNYFEDSNQNGVVDMDDKIIHAYFHPVAITTIRDWLQKDPIRPLLYIDVSRGIICPGGIERHAQQTSRWVR